MNFSFPDGSRISQWMQIPFVVFHVCFSEISSYGFHEKKGSLEYFYLDILYAFQIFVLSFHCIMILYLGKYDLLFEKSLILLPQNLFFYLNPHPKLPPCPRYNEREVSFFSCLKGRRTFCLMSCLLYCYKLHPGVERNGGDPFSFIKVYIELYLETWKDTLLTTCFFWENIVTLLKI